MGILKKDHWVGEGMKAIRGEEIVEIIVESMEEEEGIPVIYLGVYGLEHITDPIILRSDQNRFFGLTDGLSVGVNLLRKGTWRGKASVAYKARREWELKYIEHSRLSD